jgi:hypothetical protein
MQDVNFGAPKFEIKKDALSRAGGANRPASRIGEILCLLAPFALLGGDFLGGW